MICRGPTKITGTFPENLHKFRIICRGINITVTNVADKRRENQNTYFMFNNFFKEISGACECGNEPLGSVKCWKFLD